MELVKNKANKTENPEKYCRPRGDIHFRQKKKNEGAQEAGRMRFLLLFFFLLAFMTNLKLEQKST